MLMIQSTDQIDRSLPEALTTLIQCRLSQLTFDDCHDPPAICLVEPEDDVSSDVFSFAGKHGLLSDLWGESAPFTDDFVRPYEGVSFHRGLGYFEVLLLVNNESGYLILFPESVVHHDPALYWELISEEAGGLESALPYL